MRALFLALLCSSTLALGACARPAAPDGATELETSTSESTADASDPKIGGPTPDIGAPPGPSAPQAAVVPADQATPVSDPVAGDPLAPDRSCRTAADCAVKNVGNCCGMMPACVNRDAPVDPAAVKAQCEREGRMSVCGFNDVQACACVAGTCEDAGGAVAQ